MTTIIAGITALAMLVVAFMDPLFAGPVVAVLTATLAGIRSVPGWDPATDSTLRVLVGTGTLATGLLCLEGFSGLKEPGLGQDAATRLTIAAGIMGIVANMVASLGPLGKGAVNPDRKKAALIGAGRAAIIAGTWLTMAIKFEEHSKIIPGPAMTALVALGGIGLVILVYILIRMDKLDPRPAGKTIQEESKVNESNGFP